MIFQQTSMSQCTINKTEFYSERVKDLRVPRVSRISIVSRSLYFEIIYFKILYKLKVIKQLYISFLGSYEITKHTDNYLVI